MAQRSTNWVFTLNNYTEQDEERFALAVSGGKLRWCLYGREVGLSGTPHLQGVCGAASQRTLSAMRKSVHDRAHWEPMRGRVEQATDYCKKDGDIVSIGPVPVGTTSNAKEDIHEKYTTLIRLSEERNMEEIKSRFPAQYFLHYRRICELGIYNTTPLDPNQKVNVWYFGATGTGKSFRARGHGSFYLKKRNKWWDGYNDEDVAIIEEWSPGNEATAQELKIWADVYDFPAEVKGGTIRIRPRMIVITSNYRMEECFQNQSDLEPLKRRFREIECIDKETEEEVN